MTYKENGYTLTKYFEGKVTQFSLLPELRAYKCPSGYWTIGWGTICYPDGSPVNEGDTCTISQARRWLITDIKDIETEVQKLVKVNLRQGQFDALVDFGYNCGTAEKGLAGSTLLKRVNSGASMEAIEEAFLMWAKGNGEHDGKDNDLDGQVDEPGEKKFISGLLRRRKAEAWLYRYDELNFFEHWNN